MMLCQDCNKKEASIHLTQIVNNEKVVLNLCKDCAEKRGFHSPFEQVPFPLAEIVSGMIGPAKEQKKGKKSLGVSPDLKCPNCGLTFEEFGRIGRLGCAECYQAFKAELTNLLRRIHGSAEHRGLAAQAPVEDLKYIHEDKRLREELRKAIEDENFEAAAELRDRIRELSGKSEGGDE
jgi:protein arginine kinase activator